MPAARRWSAAKVAAGGPAVKRLVSFEGRSPFDGGKVVEQTATGGSKALRLDKGYASMERPAGLVGLRLSSRPTSSPKPTGR